MCIESKYLANEKKIQVIVKDTGPGIPNLNISKLFEPFFTTKKKGKGVGLGLSVAYGIIQEHGGSIFVRSRDKQGASFEVKLPLKPPPGASEKAETSLNEQIGGMCEHY
jgi:signal transduction histidine kinase